MCGRYAQTTPTKILIKHFGLIGAPELKPRYNIAPGTYPPIVRVKEGATVLENYFWGLIPSWTKDLKAGPHPINARAETASTKLMFRRLLSANRCLVPADGYYEWKKTPAGSTPHYMRLKSDEPFFFAGLWDCWHEGNKDAVQSFTILTTEPNELMAQMHNRMPVIVRPSEYDLWLDQKVKDPSAVARVWQPYPAEEMIAYPVSMRVNNPKNEGLELIERL